MALLPVFKKISREELMEKWNFEFPLSDWVEIEFPYSKVKDMDKEIDHDFYEDDEDVYYEANRYDVRFKDKNNGKTIFVYLYMNEGNSKILAIDEIVQNKKDKEQYPIEETPFWDIIMSI